MGSDQGVEWNVAECCAALSKAGAGCAAAVDDMSGGSACGHESDPQSHSGRRQNRNESKDDEGRITEKCHGHQHGGSESTTRRDPSQAFSRAQRISVLTQQHRDGRATS